MSSAMPRGTLVPRNTSLPQVRLFLVLCEEVWLAVPDAAITDHRLSYPDEAMRLPTRRCVWLFAALNCGSATVTAVGGDGSSVLLRTARNFT